MSFGPAELFQLACCIFLTWQSSWFYLALLCGLLLLCAGLAGKLRFQAGCFPSPRHFCHAIFFLTCFPKASGILVKIFHCPQHQKWNIQTYFFTWNKHLRGNILSQVEFIFKFPFFYSCCGASTVLHHEHDVILLVWADSPLLWPNQNW